MKNLIPWDILTYSLTSWHLWLLLCYGNTCEF